MSVVLVGMIRIGRMSTKHIGVLSLLVAMVALTNGCRSHPPAERETVLAKPSAAAQLPKLGSDPGGILKSARPAAAPGHELAAFAAGCFWGVEDAFRHVDGVVSTAVAYAGGHTPSPTYEEVCGHESGHAEVVLLEFDPKVVSYARLVNIFFQVHDPTTLNRQGPDVGDQYRSAVFTFAPAQVTAFQAEKAIAQKGLDKPIVTEVVSAGSFFAAETYHQQYTEKTGVHGCPIHSFK
jgi:peptide-methionine (S)-S-oxide reductase